MHADPGWAPAFSHIFKALFSRKKLMAVRPAITAARAGALAPVVTALVLGGALTVFGAPSRSDYLLAGGIVGFTVVAAAAMVFRIRYGKLGAPGVNPDPATQFLGFASVLSALATVPTLSAFVCFFLGGGYLLYGIGALATILLIIGPANPSESMARDFGSKRTPVVPGDDMWAAILDPEPPVIR